MADFSDEYPKFKVDTRFGVPVTFEQTCFACPEQYELYDPNGERIGFFHYRYGHLTLECPDTGGELVYEKMLGDRADGILDSDTRDVVLDLCAELSLVWAACNA